MCESACVRVSVRVRERGGGERDMHTQTTKAAYLEDWPKSRGRKILAEGYPSHHGPFFRGPESTRMINSRKTQETPETHFLTYGIFPILRSRATSQCYVA